MKNSRNTKDPVARTRLRRKVLERWENEGGKICTDPGDTLQGDMSPRRGAKTSTRSQVKFGKEK